MEVAQIKFGESGNDSVEINFGRVDDQEYTYDNSKSITGVYDGGEGTDKLRIQAENWYGNDERYRGEGYTIDLRDADISNFEKRDWNSCDSSTKGSITVSLQVVLKVKYLVIVLLTLL